MAKTIEDQHYAMPDDDKTFNDFGSIKLGLLARLIREERGGEESVDLDCLAIKVGTMLDDEDAFAEFYKEAGGVTPT